MENPFHKGRKVDYLTMSLTGGNLEINFRGLKSVNWWDVILFGVKRFRLGQKLKIDK